MVNEELQNHRCAQPHSVPALDLNRLNVISVLGRGAKGVVFLVKDKECDVGEGGGGGGGGDLLALKVILRDSIEKKKQSNDGSEYRRVSFEQQVLGRFDHALLPRLRGVVSTDKIVGYAIDYCPGRDLNHLRKKQTEKMFSDEAIRFYAAELVIGLGYLHGLGIVYRDLKPENIMIQENGHIMLVDFDLSTKLSPKTPQTSPTQNSVAKPDSVNKKKRFPPFTRWCNSGITPTEPVTRKELVTNSSSNQSDSDSTEKSNSFVGTEEYVPPEIISGDGHDFAVDSWSMGVVLYEMLYGVTPFRGSNRKETFFRILTRKPDLAGEPTPLRDLISKLLDKDPNQRITMDGIKGHEFFKKVDWDSILGISRPPYIPSVRKEEEDMDGIKRIDVELFVKDLFVSGDSHIQSRNKEDTGVGKKDWVKELNNQPESVNNFLVF